MTRELRYYQREGIDAVRREWDGGTQSTMLVYPTGCGKTFSFNSLLGEELESDRIQRVLILAHRDELIRQPKRDFESLYPDIPVGVVKADENQLGYPVTVSSVQTLAHKKRRESLPPVQVVIYDECHHAVAPGNEKLLACLMERNPGLRILGVTATPMRTDRKPLGSVFQSIAYRYPVGQAIAEKYLVPPKGIVVSTTADLSGVKLTRYGEYQDKALKKLNEEARNNKMIVAYRKFAEGRRMLAFCVDVQHAQDMSELANRDGIRSKAVWGDMAYDDRVRTMSELRRGDIDAIWNCMVMTEGTDIPEVSCIGLLRPSTSPSLIIQEIGRGLRLCPEIGKTDCLVLYLHDKSARIKIDALPGLIDAERETQGKTGRLTSSAPTRTVQRDGFEAIEVEFFSEHEIRGIPVDLLSGSRYAWSDYQSRGGARYWSIPVNESDVVIVHRSEDAPGKFLALAVNYERGTVRPLVEPGSMEEAMSAGEDFARRNEQPALAHRKREWRKEAASEKQRELLWRMAGHVLGGNIEWMSKGEAAERISFLRAMRTLKGGTA